MEPSVFTSPGGRKYRRMIVEAFSGNKESPVSEHTQEMARTKRMEFIQWAQLLGIGVAIAGIFLAIGRRDQTLTDLKEIVTRLVESDNRLRERIGTLEGRLGNHP